MSRQEIVVITGASAGVGRAVALSFAQRGAKIGLIARSEQALDDVVNEVKAAGGDALALVADVADYEAIEKAAVKVEETFGPIDIWVNNAMTTVFAPLMDIAPADFKRATDVTYLGYVWGTMAALKRMKERNKGTIVQVGSALAYRSIPLQSAYCGAKHAIVGFTDSLRSELMADKVNVHLTAVHLPAMNTPQFSWCKSTLSEHPQPVPPIYQPEVAAEAIYWAAHQRKREVNVSLSTWKAIIGQMVAPGYADKYLAKNGIDGQQAHIPYDQNRPNGLYHPVERHHATRGIFNGIAKESSMSFWMTKNSKKITLALVCMAAVAGVRSYSKTRSGHKAALRAQSSSKDGLRKLGKAALFALAATRKISPFTAFLAKKALNRFDRPQLASSR